MVASLGKNSATWNKRHAVLDQFCHASESIVLNLAEGARLRSPPQKQQLFELDAEHRQPGIGLLGRIVLMLCALFGSRSE